MFPSLGGGQSLGTAHGRIIVDTSSAEQARATMRRVGADIRNSMTGAGSTLSRFSSEIRSMRGELLALGAAGGVITKLGLDAARNMRAFRVAFTQLTGSQDEANDLMASLVETANQFGLEMDGVLQLSRSLLPILEGNTDELDEWVKRAALLRSTFPIAQRGAETRAISEFLAGQSMSLQRLFNVPPNVIQEAKDTFADYGDQLDFILEKQGATEEGAMQMADAFVSLRNELTLALSVGFTPLFERLQVGARDVREFVTNLRETNPAALEAGAGLAAMVALGAPALAFIGQMIDSIGKLRKSAAGKIVVSVGVAMAAAGIATEGVQAVGRATGNERLAHITFVQMVGEAIKALADMFFTWEALIAASFRRLVDALASGIEAIGGFVQAIAAVLNRIGNIIPDRLGGARLREMGEGLAQAGANIGGFSDKLREANQYAIQQFLERLIDARERVRAWADGFFGIKPREQTEITPGGSGAASIGRLGQLFRDTITDAVPGGLVEWSHFWAEMQQIQSDAHAEILAEEAEHARQRAEVIAQYDLMLLREEEDFQRQRARANEDFQRQIDEINEDRAEREAEWQEELNDKIADINEKAARDRQRMEEDHRDNLLSAASRLDARAVAEEQRRYNRQRTRFEEDLQERIDNEREAHQERIDNAREADEKRIADMREFHERRQAREDEDRAIRLERMEEDHLAQLEKMDEAHGRRIQQIEAQAAEELQAEARAYRDSLREQGIYYTNFLSEQNIRQRQSLDDWRAFWNEFGSIQGSGTSGSRTGGESGRTGDDGQAGGNRPTRQELEQQGIDLMQARNWPPQTIYNQTRTWRQWTDAQLAQWLESVFGVDVPGYAAGTPFVPQTGLAMLHKGEMVIAPRMATIIRGQMSPGMAAPQAGIGGNTLNIERGAIQITASPGMSERDLGNEVEQALIRVIEKRILA